MADVKMTDNKLNLSLGEIIEERRKTSRPQGRARRAPGGKARVLAPVGGVKKTTRQSKGAEKMIIPTGPAKSGESKIQVSNLPIDVTEANIKEYFTKEIGPIKKVFLTYGPNGQSRGIATIIFAKNDAATAAATKLDGIRVDNRPMKVEVIVAAKQAPLPVAAKGLGDRITQPKGAAKPKSQPKPVTESKQKEKGTKPSAGRPAKRGGRRGTKPKTTDELDAEMADYFVGGNTGAGGANTGAVQPPATNGDVGMDEDII